MDDFINGLKNDTVKEEDIEKGIHSSEDLAKKIKKDLKIKNVKDIAKKVETSSENKPDKVQVQNLTKTQVQGLEDIE